MRTLLLMPAAARGPKAFGNAWPAWSYSWEDQLAQQAMETDQREQIERAQNRVRILPSSTDIAHMETAIAWPARYLRDFPHLLRTVASKYPGIDLLGAAMKEALQSTLILVLWIAFWLAGTIGGAVLQAWLIDIGVVSDIDPPWIITIGSSFIGFFAGAYAAIKLGNLALRKNDRFGSKS
jgi:hypothetical protein